MPTNANKIKVCLVGLTLGKGGVDRSMALLSEMLSEQGFDVYIAILNDVLGYSFTGTLLNLGLEKRGRDSLLKRFKRLSKLKKFLSDKQIDYIIDHRPKNNMSRERFYRRYVYKGIKTIYVVHSFKQETYFGKNVRKARSLYQSNFKTVTVSEAIQKKIEAEMSLTNVQTIYNASDKTWVVNSKKSTPLPEKKYILTYGRLNDEIKDVSFLMDAYHHSHLWREGFVLVIVGEGKDRGLLEAKAKQLGLGDYIQFKGFMENPFPYIAHAHLVTLTSKWEGFPMVLLEALTLGKPVVSLNIESGPSEIIQHKKNGLLIDKREVSLFSKALQSMCLDNELYQDCAAYAKSSVEKFSKQRIAQQWALLLNDE